MDTTLRGKLVRFVVSALNDGHGINDDAMADLRALQDDDERIADIINQVESTDGRWYLPEDHPVIDEYRP
jgi:hypothetical protein